MECLRRSTVGGTVALGGGGGWGGVVCKCACVSLMPFLSIHFSLSNVKDPFT